MTRHTFVFAVAAVAALFLAVPHAASPRAVLLEARELAYDANFRNDQAGLRSALAALEPLATDSRDGAYAHYYVAWTYWALSSSQVQANDNAGALESGRQAVVHAQRGVTARPADAEFHTMLVNALVVVGFLDRSQFASVLPPLQAARARALALGPTNPRAVMMDAGAIFNRPPEMNGSMERGLARWQEALQLFDAESNAATVDALAPRWGHALAQGWIAGLYLRMTPPRTREARVAADEALRMRPDFWWVRDQVLPKLHD